MERDPYNFTFIGRSGCGKGTQAELLKNILETKFGKDGVFVFNTGTQLRALAAHQEFLTARFLDEKIMKAGEKAPDSLAIWAYTKEIIHGVTETNHLIIDGSPRTALEAQTIDELMDFLGRKNVFHIWLNSGHDSVFERMKKRGRFDDVHDNITRRLVYYEKFVVPAIEFYQKDKDHKFLEINGDQTIEKVHQDIVKAIEL